MKPKGWDTRIPEPSPLAPPTVVDIRQMPEAFYIGRQFREWKESAFSNPFKLAADTVPLRVDAINQYRDHLLKSDTRLFLPQIAGKALGCFCAPKPCHGHMLAALLSVQLANGSPCPDCGKRLSSILSPFWDFVDRRNPPRLFEAWRCDPIGECAAMGLIPRPLPVMIEDGEGFSIEFRPNAGPPAI